jgi:2-polyprenyl-3-methyl-5-hydroxy-6-metoxy-1,4-benzoquinol methylase
MDVALLVEERLFTVAYVVRHPERMKAAKSRIFMADRDRRIVQWRKAVVQTYRRGSESEAPTFVGWTSNFTNKTSPETQIREWLACTVKRIMALAPRRILEIGCGVGLLNERLAPSPAPVMASDGAGWVEPGQMIEG